MKPSHKSFVTFFSLIAVALCLTWSGSVPPAAAQEIQVTAADPPSAAQGTLNLNVSIKGKGFKKGAISKFFVTGTTNPGGIKVNSTTFRGSTEVVANIDVADTAEIAKFDIQVQNADGRTGKGTELFSVRAKGTDEGCPVIAPIIPPVEDCTYTSAGCLDISFGANGKVLIEADGTVLMEAQGHDVLIQSDGKIVVVGEFWYSNGVPQLGAARFYPDGTLDSSFGNGGIVAPVATTFNTGSRDPDGVLQPDGKIVITGKPFDIIRLNPDGTPDTGFGNGGWVSVGFPSPKGRGNRHPTSIRASDVALQSDGKIVIVGGETAFGVVRLNPDGTLDSTFANGGKYMLEISGMGDWAYAVLIQPVPVGATVEERIVVGGRIANASTGTPTGTDFFLFRLTPSGVLDPSFGPSGTGMVATDFCGTSDRIVALALDGQGNIVAAGSVGSNSGGFALARYTPNGILDTSFGDPAFGLGRTTGKATVGFFPDGEGLSGLAIQPDGRILLSGLAHQVSFALHYYGIARFESNGTLDTTFGTNGVVVTDFGSGRNYGRQIAIQADGKIIMVGAKEGVAGPGLTMARYWP